MGTALNLPSVDTANVRSGLVGIIAYISLPTIDWYLVVSSPLSLAAGESDSDDAVEISFMLLSRGTFNPLHAVIPKVTTIP